MITQELIQDASLAILLLVLIARTFVPSYLKKKGENLATKEDIAHITKQIEQVKSRFDIEKEIQKSFIFEQKECLLKFYDTITEFHYECLAINFGEFPQDKGESLFEYQKNFRVKVTESDTANKEFWDTMRPIVIKYVEAYQQYLTLLNSHLTPKQNAIA